MNELAKDTCLSCLGSGEVSNERGISRCPDCDGEGKIRSLYRRNEQRIRHIESQGARLTGETAENLNWLVGELRRHRATLYQVMTAAQEMANASGSETEKQLHRIQFEANDVLGVYDPSDEA